VIAAAATQLNAMAARLQKPIFAKLKPNREVPMEIAKFQWNKAPLHGGGLA
jgi:hypothetical protein